MTIGAVAIHGDLDHTTSAALAIRPGQEMWTDKQRAALAALGIQGVSNADLAVFMHYCQKTGLDPFSRQIYLIKRREQQGGQWVEKWTIQVGIDGFRVIRDRIAARLGIEVEYEDTIWYDDDGREHKVWLSDTPPAACRVVVLKNGKRFPGVVRTKAYAATKDGKMIAQWRTQPDHMIEKCGEAKALRRAFPNDLGGIYIPEEIGEADASVAPPPAIPTRAEVLGVVIDDVPVADSAREDAATAPARAPRRAPAGRQAPASIAPGQLADLETERARLEFDDPAEWAATVARIALVPDLAELSDLTAEQAAFALKEIRGKDRPEVVALAAGDGRGTLGGDR